MRPGRAVTGSRRKPIASTVDDLLRASAAYRSSAMFQETVTFLAKFREYAPYNNLLVRTQNPSCSYYATEKDWKRRFGRTLREDARPMLILAPMHPVLLVYDVDQTEGRALPEELRNFAHFRHLPGRNPEWNPDRLQQTIDNAERRDRVRVDFRTLSSTHAGFAATASHPGPWKMRIVIHEGLDETSRFGVLCHELAHVFSGHLGSDEDHWWPDRRDLGHEAREIEAEAASYIVTDRLGLEGESASYVSHHMKEGRPPGEVSLELITRVANRIERMARGRLRTRRPRQEKGVGARGGLRGDPDFAFPEYDPP